MVLSHFHFQLLSLSVISMFHFLLLSRFVSFSLSLSRFLSLALCPFHILSLSVTFTPASHQPQRHQQPHQHPPHSSIPCGTTPSRACPPCQTRRSRPPLRQPTVPDPPRRFNGHISLALMADPSLGPASFWTQANALLRKNLTYQVPLSL